jgi:hypothetical protein
VPKKEVKEFLVPRSESRLGDVAFGELHSFEWKGEEIWYMHAFIKVPQGYNYTLIFGYKIGEPYQKRGGSKHFTAKLIKVDEREAIESYVRLNLNGRNIMFQE